MNWHVLRVWLVMAVAVASFMAQRDISRMDPVFFRPSVPGAKALLLYMAGRYDAAAASYREHWRAAISAGATTGDVGTDLILGGDLTAAERVAHQETGHGPASLRAKLLLAEVALERDLPANAALLATEVLAVTPDDVDAEVLLAVARTREGAAGDAIAAFERAVRSGRTGGRLVSFYQVLASTGALAARA